MSSEIILEYLENDPPFKRAYLTDLTVFVVKIAGSSTLDEEFRDLEDLVSPAVWLLEKQSDPKTISNVEDLLKHYIEFYSDYFSFY